MRDDRGVRKMPTTLAIDDDVRVAAKLIAEHQKSKRWRCRLGVGSPRAVQDALRDEA
jgi:hypothetical protein